MEDHENEVPEGKNMKIDEAASNIHSFHQWGYRGKEKAHELENELKSIDLFLFHPLEPLSIHWNIAVTLLMTYILIAVPFTICFQVDVPLNHPFEIVNFCVDILLLLDIILNFNTGIIEGDIYISDRRTISGNYLKGWFCLDLVTSLPLTQIFSPFNAAVEGQRPSSAVFKFIKFFRFVKFVRVLKLLRVFKLYEKLRQWETTNESSLTLFFRAFKFILIMFVMSHISACVFMGITLHYKSEIGGESGISGGERGIPGVGEPPPTHRNDFSSFEWHPESWIAVHGYDGFGRGRTYLITLYWAFTTLTTVGYGDITAFLPLELAWTIFVMICGTSLFGYIIGNVASVMTHEDETSVLINNKIKSVLAYMRYRNFPPWIATKIRRHYEYSWKRSQVYNEEKILSELPATVRMEVALYIHKETIMKVPFLRELGEDVIPMLVIKLKPILASPRDVIIKEDYYGCEMYFVAEGELKMYVDGGEVPNGIRSSSLKSNIIRRGSTLLRNKKSTPNASDVRELEIFIGQINKGDYFAEYAILLDSPKHPMSVRSLTSCDLFSMSKASFEAITEQFPSVFDQVVKIGKKRYQELMGKLQSKRTWGTHAYEQGIALEKIEGEESYKMRVPRYNDDKPMGLTERWRRKKSLEENIRQREHQRDLMKSARLVRSFSKKLVIPIQEVKEEPVYPEYKAPNNSKKLRSRPRLLLGSGAFKAKPDIAVEEKTLLPSMATLSKMKLSSPKTKKKYHGSFRSEDSRDGFSARNTGHEITLYANEEKNSAAAPSAIIEQNSARDELQRSLKLPLGAASPETKGLTVHTMAKLKVWKNRATMHAALKSMDKLEKKNKNKGRQRHLTDDSYLESPSNKFQSTNLARKAFEMATLLEDRFKKHEQTIEVKLVDLEQKLDTVTSSNAQMNECLTEISALLRKFNQPIDGEEN